MNEKNKLIKSIIDPKWGISVILRRYFYKIMDDETFIKWRYRLATGQFPNLKNPQSYNEKLQWLKLHNKQSVYTKLVDKCDVKEYVQNKIGSEHIIPTLAVYNSFDEIDFDKLPNQFVLKTTHDSGGVVVCSDKTKLNKKAVRKKIEKSLKHNYFYIGREYPYLKVKPRIIAEKYMVDESKTELKDYKFFCFKGKCKMLFVATDRGIGDVKFDFFDTNFNHLPFKQGHPWATKTINKPVGFEKMIEIAEILSADFLHVRVDLYDINGQIYFGELTFFHNSGFVSFSPKEWDYKIGEWLQLPTE